MRLCDHCDRAAVNGSTCARHRDLGVSKVYERDRFQPHAWLDATVIAAAESRTKAEIICQEPFRCTGLAFAGPIEVCAGWLVQSFHIAGEEQLVPDAVQEGIPLLILVTPQMMPLTLRVAEIGQRITVGLENFHPIQRSLTLRFLGLLRHEQ